MIDTSSYSQGSVFIYGVRGINNLGAESEITSDTIATTPLQFSTNGNITGISGNEEGVLSDTVTINYFSEDLNVKLGNLYFLFTV